MAFKHILTTRNMLRFLSGIRTHPYVTTYVEFVKLNLNARLFKDTF